MATTANQGRLQICLDNNFMTLCSIYLEKKLRHSFLIFQKSHWRRNITSATRRPALKADQGHHHCRENSGVSNQHISLGILLSGCNSLSGELLKPLFLINLSWPLARLSIWQEEKNLTWGINFQKYLEKRKLRELSPKTSSIAKGDKNEESHKLLFFIWK